jgi:hypothetical protein
MRLSWPQHLQVSRTIELAADGQRGTALALLGVSLLMLAEDLLDAEDLLEGEQRAEEASPEL